MNAGSNLVEAPACWGWGADLKQRGESYKNHIEEEVGSI